MDFQFGKKIAEFLKGCDSQVEKFMTNMQLVQTKYVEISDLYMLEKKDEMRAKSEKLFAFWTEYFDQIQKCLPKPEEPKKEKKGKGKSAMQAAMMVELAKK